MNQSVEESAVKTKPSVYGKLAYDKTFGDGLRFRLSGSILNVGQSSSIYLYSGDRGGARYYDVIQGGGLHFRTNFY
ncbi:MAG: hypothetical protein U5J63_14490 [Fodinibius sp.]|nr:hypothetical protein [Fodinibius sp.]